MCVVTETFPGPTNQISSESFADNDTSLMTSAAIQDKILSYSYGTSSLALGETSTTAYRGDRGKTAYDHSQATHAPTNA